MPSVGSMLDENTAVRRLSVQVGQSFGQEDALRIRELIANAEPGIALEIDFRRVRDCNDVALALLARDLVSGRARVALLGMSHHQQRLLGYLGVPAARREGDERS
jgi:hypothetical protein